MSHSAPKSIRPVQVWDASTGQETLQLDEHGRRVWAVEWSPSDPRLLLSGSDDGSLRLWNIGREAATMRLAAPANVCSVAFW